MFTQVQIFAFLALALVLVPRSIFGDLKISPGALSTKTNCQNENFVTTITAPETEEIVEAYLEGFRNFPDDTCHPKRVNSSSVEFHLPLINFQRCGTTRVLSKSTGVIHFYNELTIVLSGGTETKILASCKSKETSEENLLNSTVHRLKRQLSSVLPAGFKEDENPIDVGEKIGRAPEPKLKMVVRQDGRVIGQELTVQPGSPLTVGVTLDSLSKDIYGIVVSKMEVTDTLAQSEILVHNGCTVDPYLFENFLRENGDLSAKFRAFKFPESNYVMFIATVNVCLDSCEGLSCSNGQVGYGRRRRRGIATKSDYVIETSTLLRVA